MLSFTTWNSSGILNLCTTILNAALHLLNSMQEAGCARTFAVVPGSVLSCFGCFILMEHLAHLHFMWVDSSVVAACAASCLVDMLLVHV
jgi:hypothetical protein